MIHKFVEQAYTITFGLVTFSDDQPDRPGDTNEHLVTFTVTLMEHPNTEERRVLDKIQKTISRLNFAVLIPTGNPSLVNSVVEYFRNKEGMRDWKVLEFDGTMTLEFVMSHVFHKLSAVPGFAALTMETPDRPGFKRKWAM